MVGPRLPPHLARGAHDRRPQAGRAHSPNPTSTKRSSTGGRCASRDAVAHAQWFALDALALLPSDMRKITLPLLLTTLLAVGLLLACSPKFDWRDYRSNDAPYAVLFPGKPGTQSRGVNLDGLEVNMAMAAAEVDGVTFAVGSAVLADANAAPKALAAMKTAMVKNIAGTITSDQVAGASSANGQQLILAVQAKGSQHGEPVLLIGRFIAKDKRIYQVVVIGREKHITQESVETFMSSFKLN